ncbi:replication factor RFC1 C terminal domain-containing protein, partial [Phycomyces blakesleeanus]
EEIVVPKKKTRNSVKFPSIKKEQEKVTAAPKQKTTPKASRKRNEKEDDDDDDFLDDGDDDTAAPKQKKAKKTPAKVKEETEPPAKKSGFFNMMRREQPKALGTREVPEARPNCFEGYTFVLTGELESLTRNDTGDIIKRYGGRVTGSVSGRTTFLVMGRDFGPSKAEKAKSLGVTILDEDAFYNLLKTEGAKGNYGNGPNPQPTASQSKGKDKATSSSSRIAIKDILGNKTQILNITKWLKEWQENKSKGFPIKDSGWSGYRAILISGPPGIGKTTAAHVIAEECGYHPLEFNASDARTAPKTLPGSGKKIAIIMDEVDGMSAGDRGGAVELASLIKKTKVPIICICNDDRSAKVQPLLRVCCDAKFRRTPATSIRNRITEIATKEGLNISPNAIDALVASTRNDIRQIINILSTYRLGKQDMDYDQAKAVGKSNEKYSQMGLFDIPPALLSASNWRSTSLQEKSNVYFHDYNLAHLMIFENYLKAKPEKVMALNNPGSEEEQKLLLGLLAKASEAMSEGDVVDAVIHGSTQNYSLMPIHSIASCVRPASFMRGSLMGGRLEFPKWLGQNSKALKSYRNLKELQMRINSTGLADRGEIRENYIPILTDRIFTALKDEDFEKASDLMDKYHLDRECLDMLNELSLSKKKPFATITPKIKTNFNKYYNSTSHPILFQATGAPIKKVYKQEEIGEQSETLFGEEEDEGEVLTFGDDVSEEEEPEVSVKKDKFIKASK